jgi:hypothetical protein
VDRQVSEIFFLICSFVFESSIYLNHAGEPGDGGTQPGYTWAKEMFSYIVDVIHSSKLSLPFIYDYFSETLSF